MSKPTEKDLERARAWLMANVRIYFYRGGGSERMLHADTKKLAQLLADVRDEAEREKATVEELNMLAWGVISNEENKRLTTALDKAGKAVFEQASEVVRVESERDSLKSRCEELEHYRDRYSEIVVRCRNTKGRCFCGVHFTEVCSSEPLPAAAPEPKPLTLTEAVHRARGGHASQKINQPPCCPEPKADHPWLECNCLPGKVCDAKEKCHKLDWSGDGEYELLACDLLRSAHPPSPEGTEKDEV